LFAGVTNKTNGTLTIYLDGVVNYQWSSSCVSQIPYINTGGTFKIGGTLNYFLGSIDGVRSYNRALSAEEIAAQYNNTKIRYQ
jgi:hypothetical protein